MKTDYEVIERMKFITTDQDEKNNEIVNFYRLKELIWMLK